MDLKQEKLQMVTTFYPLDLLCIEQNIVPYQNTVCDQQDPDFDDLKSEK
jgi:hypothetical protein